MTFDWRKEFARQHGRRPDAALVGSQAKADVEVDAGPHRAPLAHEECRVQTAKVESVSRPAAGRSAAATSERMDVTSRERPAPHSVPEAPTATAETGPSQPAPAKASDLPGGEASPGGATVNPSGPAEIIREEGESGAPTNSDVDRLADDGCPHEEPRMIQIGPGQFVNERSARALGLVPE